MKRYIKQSLQLGVSLAIGAVCTYLLARDMNGQAVRAAFAQVSAHAVGAYVLVLAATHFFRAIRWRYLLRAIGVEMERGRLLAISSVGFMAILALPFRLGELVRPYYVVRQGKSRMSEILGTVAVERVVDGLVVSCLLISTFALASAHFSRPIEILGGVPLRYFAWLSVAVFGAATAFLVAALLLHEPAIRSLLRLSGLAWVAPRLAERVQDKLTALVQGFRSLGQPGNLLPFLFQTLLYWICNGLGMWLLARSMDLPLSLTGAFAAMAFTGVVVSLPNSPGLVGQFHLGVVAVLDAFLDPDLGRSLGLAYAIVLHAVQAVWYLTVGLLCMRAAGGGKVGSLREAVRASQTGVSLHDSAEPTT